MSVYERLDMDEEALLERWLWLNNERRRAELMFARYTARRTLAEHLLEQSAVGGQLNATARSFLYQTLSKATLGQASASEGQRWFLRRSAKVFGNR